MSRIIQQFSAGGVVYLNGKVLAIKMLVTGEISFPKGTIKDGEKIQTTAVREVYEETGYKTRIVAPIGTQSYEFNQRGSHYAKTVTYFLLELIDPSLSPTPEREPGENFENLWLNLNQALMMLTHEGSKQILKNAMKIIIPTS
jgi:8-oxo-dGTP pyrophosphatase MutT (NUDIX family)